MASALKQRDNNLRSNGHSIIPGRIPPFTLLYHARKDFGAPPQEEWVGFDADEGIGIMMGRPGPTYLSTYYNPKSIQVLYCVFYVSIRRLVMGLTTPLQLMACPPLSRKAIHYTLNTLLSTEPFLRSDHGHTSHQARQPILAPHTRPMIITAMPNKNRRQRHLTDHGAQDGQETQKGAAQGLLTSATDLKAFANGADL